MTEGPGCRWLLLTNHGVKGKDQPYILNGGRAIKCLGLLLRFSQLLGKEEGISLPSLFLLSHHQYHSHAAMVAGIRFDLIPFFKMVECN